MLAGHSVSTFRKQRTISLEMKAGNKVSQPALLLIQPCDSFMPLRLHSLKILQPSQIVPLNVQILEPAGDISQSNHNTKGLSSEHPLPILRVQINVSYIFGDRPVRKS